ncbi:MAG: bifunctional UDP-3-O-[3-hydroxymyristoyl] N-acetylglucosamine deacetylase/3-hydroxyacyl-ACP dehydratase [Cytophagales bacterium]|nr:bifunctional UDP-3-O-[3-hydroxymyristoyl] N-acetylglucosamine deacetylase/3-hydroxyacyl-ACP dehydratase [Cytophagales bacterium]
MQDKQHTIKSSVSLSGVGLHTGIQVNMKLLPANPNHGIKFQRIDLEDEPVVEADVDNVTDVSRGTTIEQNRVKVHTVEHILAAVVGLEIDNILIQLDAPEPPIMDGSSKMFVEALSKSGLQEQNVPRNFFEIPEGVTYKNKEHDIEITALPHHDYRVAVMIDYNSPILGNQHASLNDIGEFCEEIAESRTFCFLHELEALYKQNLIKGGSLNNAIVVVDRDVRDDELDHLASLFDKPKVKVNGEGILNNAKLRYKNEPARHKLLDLIGDMALIGRPIKGQILATKPGHEANIAFAKKIKKLMLDGKKQDLPHYNPKLPPILDINQISKTLPHNYPFRLVDKIIHLDEKSVVGVKNVTINEPFFQGHFPGNPIMPGVLQVEAMAQTGGILVLNTVPDPENYWTYFLGIDSCRFKKMVVPGDTIIFRCELTNPIKRGIAKMHGQAFVADKLVCEAFLMASIVKKSD